MQNENGRHEAASKFSGETELSGLDSPKAADYAAAARALTKFSYAIIELPDELFRHVDAILTAGRAFFELPTESKQQCRSVVNDLEGYRAMGEELDPETGLEDLAEGFAVWRRNERSAYVRQWSRNCDLHGVMSGALEEFGDFASEVLSALRREVTSSHDAACAHDVNIRELSYLQQNYYRPIDHVNAARQNVMEPHEDGHLLTVLKPTAPGLAVSPRSLIEPPTPSNPLGVYGPPDDYVDITLDEREVILIPSTPTALLTGGEVKPLWHGVRNMGAPRRQALMFFVNPDPRFECAPWVESKILSKYDIHEVVDLMSSNYGKTSISQSDHC